MNGVCVCLKESLEILMKEGNVEKAIDMVREEVRNLLCGKIDIYDLVITKEYKKKSKDSKTKQVSFFLSSLFPIFPFMNIFVVC